jgi:hypothetical protein
MGLEMKSNLALTALVVFVGCRAGTQAPVPKTQPTASEANTSSSPQPAEHAALPVAGNTAVSDTLAAPGQVLIMREGNETWMDATAATRAGYTVVDLHDDFTPLLFTEQRSIEGKVLHNRYRRVFMGLANDSLDEDGAPLPAGEKNYLELYGIPPSLSVLRARFMTDEMQTCIASIDQEKLEAVETVGYIAPERMRVMAKKAERNFQEIEKARRKAKVATFAELAAKDPSMEPKIKAHERRLAEKKAMTEVEKRLTCEGMWKKVPRHTPGVYDDAMRAAVRRFQQKNMIYESNYLRSKTMDALARPPIANDHMALVRVIRERVVDAAGILEDGSVETKSGAPTYADKSGKTIAVRNLVDEFTQATVKQLGLDTPEGALAFFKRHPATDFRHLRAAVRLPPLPDYYGPNMDLSIVIDRGDVWYDLPWDEKGVRHPQPRKRYPSFQVYLRHNEKRIPLARWRTTIGGWRAEQASDSYEYFRYKGSDVGARVIRTIIAGPVWIAPESTPIRSLIKKKTVNGSWQRVVDYDDLGPGFLSAYGLVAGYFVVPGKDGRPDWDNGIRAHGSSDYLSIYSSEGYSHGCHRLPNHLAIRLYSFILRHRPMRVLGDQGMGFARQFLAGNDVFEIRLPSRGFSYQLDPPLPVLVLEGEIKGNTKTPPTTYIPKPGLTYPGPPPPVPNSPEARAESGAGARGEE